MVMSRVSADRDLEVADVRSLLRGPDRPRTLRLLADLHDDLMTRTLPESEIEDFDSLVDRLDGTQGISGPEAVVIVIGRDLLCDGRKILAFGLADYFPQSRCALVTALEREAVIAHDDLWIGTRTIIEVLRERLVDRAEILAGATGLRGVFTECRDPDAEGLVDPEADAEAAPSLARSRRERRRMRGGQIGWELLAVPIDYVRPAFGFGGGFGGPIWLCICADSVRRFLPDRETIKAFLVELWTTLAGRPPGERDADALRMLRQASAL